MSCYTGIIVPNNESHVMYVGFDEQAEGEIVLEAFVETHPGVDAIMVVGEPGDPDDSARWVVTIDNEGVASWRVPAPGEDVFA